MFESDAKLGAGDFGGPVVGLNGLAIGLTVARTHYGCLVLSGREINGLVSKLKETQ